VDPSANDVTRQVEVLVNFDDAKQPRVAGLYAEGTIEASKTQSLSLPESMLVRSGDKTSVWRVKGNVLNQANLTLGTRDPRTGNFEVRSGLSDGDLVLRNPSASFKEAQAVEMVGVKPASVPASSASNVKGT
jgi:hypothetical protein